MRLIRAEVLEQESRVQISAMSASHIHSKNTPEEKKYLFKYYERLI